MTVKTKPSRPNARPRATIDYDLVAGLLACIVAVALTLPLVRTPAHVNSVTIANPTDYDITVSARPTGGGGTVRLATVDPNASTTIRDVIDLGDRWTFDFDWAGTATGTSKLTRRALEKAQWHISVPESAIPGPPTPALGE